MTLRYQLCTDPEADLVCNSVIFDALSSDPVLAGSNNAWFTITEPVAAGDGAETSNGNHFYVLTITPQITEPVGDRFNMFKLGTNYSMIKPFGPFSFGTPLQSLSDALLIYPNFPVTTPTTYDGVFEFSIQLELPATDFRVWDGDFDFGSENCFVAAEVDSDDPDSEDIPQFILDIANANGTTPAAMGVEVQGADVEFFLDPQGNPACITTVAPLDDDPADGPWGPLWLRTPSVGQNVIFKMTGPAPLNAEFLNLNPSGNREWEQFRVGTPESGCAAGVDADHCADFLTPGTYNLRVEGQDILNINSIAAEVSCEPICPDCDVDLCADGLKPTEMTFLYSGKDCIAGSNNEQTGDTCVDYGTPPPPLPALAHIRVQQPNGQQHIWFDEDVNLGQAFVVSPAPRKGFSGGNFVVSITDPLSGGLLQESEFHISCSQPLNIGDDFGAVQVLAGI